MYRVTIVPARISRELADRCNRESAIVYNAALKNHWRTWNEDDEWLSKHQAQQDLPSSRVAPRVYGVTSRSPPTD